MICSASALRWPWEERSESKWQIMIMLDTAMAPAHLINLSSHPSQHLSNPTFGRNKNSLFINVDLWKPWISVYAGLWWHFSSSIKMFQHILAPFPSTLWNCETYPSYSPSLGFHHFSPLTSKIWNPPRLPGACKCRERWDFWSLFLQAPPLPLAVPRPVLN